MRHGNYKNKLSLGPSHRKAMMRNISIELIDHKKIKTTHARCKAVKGFIERLITLAKNDTLANRRLALSRLDNKNAVKVLFEEVGPKFKDRNGGYTRIVKLPDGRIGDGARLSYIAFVD
jgi:large subunit ribosomal protein L17